MKSFFSFALLLFSLVTFSQLPSDSPNKSYSRSGYTIQYPTAWRLDTSKIMGSDLFLFSQLEDTADKFSENVNVMIQNLAGQDIDLPQYKNISETQVAQLLTEGKILESKIVKSDKGDRYELKALMTQGIYKLRMSSYCYLKDGNAYLVTFSCEAAKYDAYKKYGEQIMESFHLKK